MNQTQSLTVPLPTSPEWLAREASAAPRIRQHVAAIEVSDEASMQSADALTKQLLQLRDRLEAERKSVTGPLLDAKRRVDGWFKPVTDILEVAIRDLKNKVAAHLIEQKRKQDELYRLAAAAHTAATQGVQGAHEVMSQALAATSDVSTAAPQGTSVREVWTAEVFNPAIVPCSYHIVDTARIQAEARATPSNQEPSPIPGVRFIKRAETTMRR
jgi:hypothetical protein